MAENIQITIDTEQVNSIADQIETYNKNLKEKLESTKATIDALSATWTGPAADETRAAYAEFSNKFFQQYYDIIDQYVKFLRKNVSANYTNIEGANESLANQFK